MPKLSNICMTFGAAGVLAFPSAAAASAQQYELTAYEAPGMIPNTGEVIIRDARKRIPPLIRKCGIASVETQDRTDGAVAFHFFATAKQLPCLKKTLPRGTRLDRI